MIIRHTSIIECFCDQCHKGMMKSVLDGGFTRGKSSIDMKGTVIKCDSCGHGNTIEEVYTCIPSEFLWFGASDLVAMKSKLEKSVSDFLEE